MRLYRLANQPTCVVSLNEVSVRADSFNVGNWTPRYFTTGLETRDSQNSVTPGYTASATLQWLFFSWQTTWPSPGSMVEPGCNLSAFWNTPGWGWIDDQN